MRTVALVRQPSSTLSEGERTHIERVPIDHQRALEQHHAYVAALEDAGAEVVHIPPAEHLPDAVFVEDTALVLDTLAVVASPPAAKRRAEVPSVTRALSLYRHLVVPPAVATFDGGDALVIGSTVYIGRSLRTNQAAIDYLTTLLRPYAYKVVSVPVPSCLHLKTAVTCVGRNTILINPDWVSREAFSRHQQIEVDPEEPGAANALRVGSQLFLSASYPRTAARVEEQGFAPRLLQIGEFHRAEGGLTCLSILVANGCAL